MDYQRLTKEFQESFKNDYDNLQDFNLRVLCELAKSAHYECIENARKAIKEITLLKGSNVLGGFEYIMDDPFRANCRIRIVKVKITDIGSTKELLMVTLYDDKGKDYDLLCDMQRIDHLHQINCLIRVLREKGQPIYDK